MGLPWCLKPDWLLHAEMLDAQEELSRSASSSYATGQKQDREIEKLQKRVTELEGQLLALERLLAEKGILPPLPEEAPKASAPGCPPIGTPVVFPARVKTTIACPRCGKCQKGDRDLCYSCETPFLYENE